MKCHLKFSQKKNRTTFATVVTYRVNFPTFFVCVEVLLPNQPNVVMSSSISLPNHTCTGQA